MLITQKQLESIYKVNLVYDKYVELLELIRSLKKDEYDMLIRSLEKLLKEQSND